MKTTYLDTSETGVIWYEMTGTDSGTEIEFEKTVFGVTGDNTIVDCDGSPLTEGDHETIAVRNSL